MFVRIFITCTTKCLIGYRVPEDRDVVEVAADGLFFSFFNTVSVTYSLRMLFPSVPYSPKLPPEHIYTPSLHPICKFESHDITIQRWRHEGLLNPLKGGNTSPSISMASAAPHSSTTGSTARRGTSSSSPPLCPSCIESPHHTKICR